MRESPDRIGAIHIGHHGVPGRRGGLVDLWVESTMVAQDDAYAIKDFTGGCSRTDRIQEQVRHVGTIDAPHLFN
jgi:hypothetical protein